MSLRRSPSSLGSRLIAAVSQSAMVQLLGVRLDNLPGEVPQSSVTDLEGDLAAKAAIDDLAADDGAAGVGFLQSGTGAVLRTLLEKDRDVVSVRDFGATGDGTTDDTAAIQKALNKAGAIYLPDGVYRTTASLDITNGSLIYGSMKAIIQADGADFVAIKGTGLTAVRISGITVQSVTTQTSSSIEVHAIAITSSSGCVFENVQVDYRNAATVDNGIDMTNCNACVVRGCTFVNAPDMTSQLFSGGGADIAFVESCSENLVIGNHCTSGQVYGINFTTSSVARGWGNRIIGNFCKGNTGYGIILYRHVNAGTSTEIGGSVIANNVIEDTTGGSYITGTECRFGSGIYVQMHLECVVSGNVVRNSASATNSATLPIGGISSTCNSIVITNNRVETSGVVGIHTVSGAAGAAAPDPTDSQIVVSNNIVSGCDGAGIKSVNARRIVMANNNILSADTGIEIDSTTTWKADATVTGNLTDSCSNVGLVLKDCTQLVCTGNVAKGCTSHGFSFFTVDWLMLNGNSSFGNGGRGYDVGSSVSDGIADLNLAANNTSTGMNMAGNLKLGDNNRLSGNSAETAGSYGASRTLADAATPSVKNGRLFVTGGTTAITNFSDGEIGQEITIQAAHAVTITNGANSIRLAGSANFAMAVGDTLTLVRATAGRWDEVSRMVR